MSNLKPISLFFSLFFSTLVLSDTQTAIEALELTRATEITLQYIGYMIPSTPLENKEEVKEYLNGFKKQIKELEGQVYLEVAKNENDLPTEVVTEIIALNSQLIKSLNIAMGSNFKKLNPLKKQPQSFSDLKAQIEIEKKILEKIGNDIEYIGLSTFNKFYRDVLEKEKYSVLPTAKRLFTVALAVSVPLFLINDEYLKTNLNHDNIIFNLIKAYKSKIGSFKADYTSLSEAVNDLNRASKDGWFRFTQELFSATGYKLIPIKTPVTLSMIPYVTRMLNRDFGEIPKWVNEKTTKAKIYLRGGKFAKRNTHGETPKETLDALVGPEHVANTCLRVVEQCANPMPFEDSNKKIRGVLFCGPSRTGKTFAAKAICGEINKRLGTSKYKFLYHIASNFSYGSNAFDNIISEAEALAPCILCIEEIDTLNLQKGMSQQQMRTLGDFLGWMGDGPLETLKSKGVIIIGITNNPEKLDKALLQPGRFDRIVVFDLPSFKHRMEHLEKQLVKFSIDLSETIKYKIIQSTEGKTYADLDNIISCVIEKSKELNQPIKDAFFEDAIDLEIYKIDLPQKDLSVEQLNAVSAYHSGKTLMTKILFPEKIISRATVNPVKKAIEENKKLNEYF